MTRPDTLQLLIQAIADRNDPVTGQGGQTAVAKDLGCSSSLLNQLRGGKVPLSPAMHARILECYGTETINCPELGDITHAICAEERRKPWSTSRYRFYKACKKCPNNGGRP